MDIIHTLAECDVNCDNPQCPYTHTPIYLQDVDANAPGYDSDGILKARGLALYGRGNKDEWWSGRDDYIPELPKGNGKLSPDEFEGLRDDY